jgi:hypothetical protein
MALGDLEVARTLIDENLPLFCMVHDEKSSL